MAEKRYYWIKLRYEFFFEDGAVDFIMRSFPKDGARYILLYQMLCLRTKNNDGELCTRIGEMIVPYDIDKIVDECKYFKESEVALALELFKKLSLIYKQEDGIFRIVDFENIVGTESDSAARVRRYRNKQKEALPPSEAQTEALRCALHCNGVALHCNKGVTKCNVTSLKESFPYLSKKKETDTEADTEVEPEVVVVYGAGARTTTTTPSIAEINAYANEKGIHTDIEGFYAYNEMRGWTVKNWKGALKRWAQKEEAKAPLPQKTAVASVAGQRISTTEYQRAVAFEQLNTDEEYRALDVDFRRKVLALSKAELSGENTAELSSAVQNARDARAARVRELGFNPALLWED